MTDQPEAGDKTPRTKREADQTRGPFVRPLEQPTTKSSGDADEPKG